MTWAPVTLETVRDIILDARINKAIDASFEAQVSNRFESIKRGVVAEIRARISESHTLDANQSLLPPEFVMLAALRIAQVLLGRPGNTVNREEADPYALHSGQKAELDRLEKRLDAVSQGAKVTATDNPETSETSSSGSPEPSITSPTPNWDRDSQSGIGAY